MCIVCSTLRLQINLEALRVLAADNEAANLPCAAEELQRRVEHYPEREIIKVR
jgi:hypothetical protein